MSSYMSGVSLGIRLSKYIPRKIGLGAGILLFAFIGWAVYDSFADKAHYNKLRAEAENILAAEQKYFAQKGKYTADLRLLDYKIPPSSAELKYEPSRYVEDLGQTVLSAETFSFTLENGDSILVSVSAGLNYNDGEKDFKYSVLGVSAFPKFGSLPASYSVRAYFDHGGFFERDLIKQCDVNILNASKAERDIETGGKFCKRLGALPTDIALIWLFSD